MASQLEEARLASLAIGVVLQSKLCRQEAARKVGELGEAYRSQEVRHGRPRKATRTPRASSGVPNPMEHPECHKPHNPMAPVGQ